MLAPQHAQVKTYRFSPWGTWLRSLRAGPNTHHYKITAADGQLNGSATLQRFPVFAHMGRSLVPILAHWHAYAMQRGGQFAGFTSRVMYFDSDTGAIAAMCNYSDNRSAAMHVGMGPWDWIAPAPVGLEWPQPALIMDFGSSSVSYTSAWVPCSLYMAALGTGIGQGNAYVMGDQYTLPGTEVAIKCSIASTLQANVACYRHETRTARDGKTSLETVEFLVDVAKNLIVQAHMPTTVVEVDAQGQHTWVERQSIWTRID